MVMLHPSIWYWRWSLPHDPPRPSQVNLEALQGPLDGAFQLRMLTPSAAVSSIFVICYFLELSMNFSNQKDKK